MSRVADGAIEKAVDGILLLLLSCVVTLRILSSGTVLEEGSHHVVQLLAFFCGVLVLVKMYLSSRVPVRVLPAVAASWLFIGMCLVWTVVAPHKQPAVLTLLSLTCDVIIFSVILVGLEPPGRRVLLLALVSSAVVAACIALQQYAGGLGELRRYVAADPEKVRLQLGIPERMWSAFVSRLQSDRVFGPFMYPNALGGFLVVVLPILAGMFADTVFRKGVGLQRLVSENHVMALSGMVLLAAYCLYLSGSKGAMAALICSLVLVGAWRAVREGVGMRYVVAGGGVLAVLLAVVLFCSGLYGKLAASLGVRVDYWRVALELGRDRLFLGGVGLRNFADFYTAYKPPEAEEVRLAHSWLMQFLAEGGVFLVASYAAVWLAVLRPLGVAAFSGDDTAGKEDGAERWWVLGGGIAAFLLCIFLRDIVPFSGVDGAFSYHKWFGLGVVWFLGFLLAGRARVHLGGWLSLGVLVGVVGFVLHSLGDVDTFVHGVHQSALVAAACCVPWSQLERTVAFGRRLRAGLLGAAALLAGILALLVNGLLPLPDLFRSYYDRMAAREAVAEGRLEKAAWKLTEAWRVNRWDDEAAAGAAELFLRLYRRSGDRNLLSAARRMAAAAVDAAPVSFARHSLAARVYLESGMLPRATAHAFRALSLYPANPLLYVQVGDVLRAAGDTAGARLCYARALRLEKRVFQPWLHIPVQRRNEINEFLRRPRRVRDGGLP